MKKLLGILVLGLLLSGNAYGLSNQEIINKYLSNKKLDPVEGLWKSPNSIIIIWEKNGVFYMQTTADKKCNIINTGTKSSSKVINISVYGYKSKKRCTKYKQKAQIEIFSQGNSAQTYITFPGSTDSNFIMPRIWPDDIISHNAKFKSEEDIKDEEKELALIVNDVKRTCGILGFEPGSEKFADCTLKLYTQKIDEKIAAKQEANNRSLQTSSTTTQSSSGTNTTIIYDPVRDKQNKIDRGMKMLGGKCTLGVDC